MAADDGPLGRAGGPLPEEPDQYLVQHVREALAQDARVSELDVHVAMTGGKVMVTGTVATQGRKDAISEVVHELLPDLQVVNDTTVVSLSGIPEPEELP